MSITDETFFRENIVEVNKMVRNVLLGTIFVPVMFIALTIPGIWVVPHSYSLSILVYSTCMPSSGIAGLYGSFIFSFLSNLCIIPHSLTVHFHCPAELMFIISCVLNPMFSALEYHEFLK